MAINEAAMTQQSGQGTFTADHRFTEAVGLGIGPVPLDPYRSADFFERERTHVFGRAWLVLAREEEIASPGDFVLKDVETADASVLLTRSKSGAVQAFYNSCSHRSTEVVSARSGNAARFVCPYHNWTYANDGSLIGVPDEKAFFALDKKKCGLTPIATEISDGFVFINFQPKPEVSLETFLGPLKSYLAGVHFAFADNAVVIRSMVNANWKVVSDAFLESYHIPAIHPETIGSTFSSNDNPFARLLDVKVLGEHAAVSMYGNPGYELQDKHRMFRVAQSMEGSGNIISAGKMSDLANFLAHEAVNPTKSGSWSMDSIHIFPHTHINWGPGGFWLHQFWPVAVDRTRHEVRFYMAKPRTVRERLQQELYVGQVMEIIAEDLSNMERTQRGIRSRGKQSMQLQDNEVAIRRSVNNVMRWAAAETVTEAMSR